MIEIETNISEPLDRESLDKDIRMDEKRALSWWWWWWWVVVVRGEWC